MEIIISFPVAAIAKNDQRTSSNDIAHPRFESRVTGDSQALSEISYGSNPSSNPPAANSSNWTDPKHTPLKIQQPIQQPMVVGPLPGQVKFILFIYCLVLFL